MKKTLVQLVRYGVVGLASNSFGYILYLGITYFGIGPKIAMSLLYCIGVVQTFIFNKRWTFVHNDSGSRAFIRYCVSYGLGYILNLLALFVFVDRYGYPHQWVQGFMILSLSAMLFLLQKFWVFRSA